MTDNRPDKSISGSDSWAVNNSNSFAKVSNDLTSPQDTLAMKRCLTNCLFVFSSNPSAMFADMDITARSNWFFKEKFRQFLLTKKTSLASLMASCQTISSSNRRAWFISMSLCQNSAFGEIHQSPCFASLIIFFRLTHFTSFTGSTTLPPPRVYA